MSDRRPFMPHNLGELPYESDRPGPSWRSAPNFSNNLSTLAGIAGRRDVEAGPAPPLLLTSRNNKRKIAESMDIQAPAPEEEKADEPEPLAFLNLPPSCLKRIVAKMDVNEFASLDLTCIEAHQACEADTAWRQVEAKAIIWRNDILEVMRSTTDSDIKDIPRATATRHCIFADYLCLYGELSDAVINEINDLLRENKAKVRRIIIGPVAGSVMDPNPRVKLRAAPEKMNMLAETLKCERMLFCNVDFEVELYTTARAGRKIRELYLPDDVFINQRQLDRVTFTTLVARLGQGIDSTCIIKFIEEWNSGLREIKFLLLKMAGNLNSEETLKRMASNISLNGGSLWSSFYSRDSIGEVFPLKWADPEHKDKAWIFINNNLDALNVPPPLFLFFTDRHIALGTTDGFRQNASRLPPGIMEIDGDLEPDYAYELGLRTEHRAHLLDPLVPRRLLGRNRFFLHHGPTREVRRYQRQRAQELRELMAAVGNALPHPAGQGNIPMVMHQRGLDPFVFEFARYEAELLDENENGIDPEERERRILARRAHLMAEMRYLADEYGAPVSLPRYQQMVADAAEEIANDQVVVNVDGNEEEEEAAADAMEDVIDVD